MGSGSVVARTINVLLVIVVALIGLHTVFVLFDGNPDNPIVAFVSGIASVLLAPFEGMFRRQSALVTAAVGAIAYCLLAGIALAIDNRVGAGARPEQAATDAES